MANRHDVQKKAKGGGVAPKKDGHKKAYNAQGSNVEKEAEEKNRGGKTVQKATGGAAKPRLDKRARGGGTGKDMTKSPFSYAHIRSNGDAGK